MMPVNDISKEPLVFEPLSGVHKHTIILLHGRGKRADTFSADVLNTVIHRLPILNSDFEPTSAVDVMPAVSYPTSFQQALPDAKFVFPSARKQRATVYKRSLVRQWFDDWHLGPGHPTDVVDARYDEGLQTSGLGETVSCLHGMITEEARLVGGARNVVLGGISQGGAASLTAALLWAGAEGLGGVVVICAWLPYTRQIMNFYRPEACQDHNGGEEHGAGSGKEGDDFDDPFERSASPGRGDHEGGCSPDAALDWLRDEIELPSTLSARELVAKNSTPVMLCHGRNDVQVAPERSDQASKILPDLGMGPVLRRTSAGVGHDFSEDMLSDIVGFLRQALGRSRVDEPERSVDRTRGWTQVRR